MYSNYKIADLFSSLKIQPQLNIFLIFLCTAVKAPVGVFAKTKRGKMKNVRESGKRKENWEYFLLLRGRPEASL